MYFIVQRATCDILPDLFVHLFTLICKKNVSLGFINIYIYIYIYIYINKTKQVFFTKIKSKRL